MANDPFMINASGGAPAYAAAEMRQALAAGLMYGGRNMGARQGVRPGGDQLQVSLVGSTITVKSGVAVVDPGLSTPQGPYWVPLSPDETHTLTAAHVTLARKDIVVLRVYDHDEDSSGNRFSRSEYIAGTASGSPAEPAVPAGAFRLATIDVPASGGGSPVVTNNAPLLAGPGGIVPVRSSTERTAVGHNYDGQLVWRQDRVNWIEFSDGAAWHLFGPPIVTSTGDLANVANPYSGQVVSNSGDGLLYRYNGTAFVPLPGLISAQTLGGTTASVSFSTIPTGFRNLMLKVQARGDTAATATALLVRFNADTGNNYDAQSAFGQTTTTGAAESVAANAMSLLEIAAASAAANHAGVLNLLIEGYGGPWIKTVDGTSTSSIGTGAGTLITRKLSGRWRSTSAITSITLVPAAGSFVSGSRFELYGE